MVNEKKEQLKGGRADYRPDSDFDPEELRLGREHEKKDHGGTEDQIDELVKDHLAEDPKYYSKLKKKEKDKNESFDISKYRAWLDNSQVKQETNNNLLIETNLSKYWNKRAERRSSDRGREWPNQKDESWAAAQQAKSESINSDLTTLFEKELQVSEELAAEAQNMMKEIKKKRKKMKQRAFYKKFGPGTPNKAKGSISVPLGPEYGGVVKGYKKKLKKLKKKGIAGVAPGETFGPMQEGFSDIISTFSSVKNLGSFIKNYIKNFDLSKITTNVVNNVLKTFQDKQVAANSNNIINSLAQINEKKKRGRISDDIDKYLIPFINKYGLLPFGIYLLYSIVKSGNVPSPFIIDMIYSGAKNMEIGSFFNKYFDDPALIHGAARDFSAI